MLGRWAASLPNRQDCRHSAGRGAQMRLRRQDGHVDTRPPRPTAPTACASVGAHRVGRPICCAMTFRCSSAPFFWTTWASTAGPSSVQMESSTNHPTVSTRAGVGLGTRDQSSRDGLRRFPQSHAPGVWRRSEVGWCGHVQRFLALRRIALLNCLTRATADSRPQDKPPACQGSCSPSSMSLP